MSMSMYDCCYRFPNSISDSEDLSVYVWLYFVLFCPWWSVFHVILRGLLCSTHCEYGKFEAPCGLVVLLCPTPGELVCFWPLCLLWYSEPGPRSYWMWTSERNTSESEDSSTVASSAVNIKIEKESHRNDFNWEWRNWMDVQTKELHNWLWGSILHLS